MQKYGDLLDDSITIDPDIAKRIKAAIVQATKENNGEKPDYNAVISKLVASESKIEDSTLLYSQVQSFDLKQNDKIVFDNFYYIDLSEGKLHRTMDTLKEYIKPYLIDILAALVYNLDYDMISDSDSIPLDQYYEKVADISDNGVREKVKFFDKELDVETDEPIYSMPFTLDYPKNHSHFCEYTWRAIYKDEKNIKCFDLRTKNGNNQRVLNKIIDAISIDPTYLFRDIEVNDEETGWLLDLFKIEAQNSEQRMSALKDSIKKFILGSKVGIDTTAFLKGYEKDEALIKLGFNLDNGYPKKSDIKKSVVSLVREYLIGSNLKNIQLFATQNDAWLIEKIFGCNAVLAFYPIVNEVFDRKTNKQIYDSIFSEIMKCKPLTLRKYISKLVAYYLQELLYSKCNKDYSNPQNNNIFDEDQISQLIVYLKGLIKQINVKYYSLLRSFYEAIKEQKIIFDKKNMVLGNSIYLSDKQKDNEYIKEKIGSSLYYIDDLSESIKKARNIKDMRIVCENYSIKHFMSPDYYNMKNVISQNYRQPSLKQPTIAHTIAKFAFLETIALKTSYSDYRSL